MISKACIGAGRDAGVVWSRGAGLLLVVLAATAWGCGDESTSGGGAAGKGGDGGAGAGAAGNCADRCAARADACGQPPEACTDVCASGPSEAALACLEGLPCSADEADVTSCLNQGSGGSGTTSSGACVPLQGTNCNVAGCCEGSCFSDPDLPNFPETCCFTSALGEKHPCTEDADCCPGHGTCQTDPDQDDPSKTICL